MDAAVVAGGPPAAAPPSVPEPALGAAPAVAPEEGGGTASPADGAATASSPEEAVPGVRTVSLHGVGTRPVRIVCLSDTHGLQSSLPPGSVPPGDVLIHCGDFTQRGSEEEVRAFAAFLEGLPHPTKLVVAGNHDVSVFSEFRPEHAERLLPGARYLDNELVEVAGLRIYGSPWNRRASPAIPPGVDVLVTHGPPEGVLDGGRGCPHLREEVEEAKPRLHVFGHIHEAAGVVTPAAARGGEASPPTTTFANVAMANDGMVAKRLDKPITVIEASPWPAPASTMPSASEEEAALPDGLAARAGRAISRADFLLIAGGAGMSADSGLPTFGTMTQKLGSALGGLTYDQAAGSNTMFQDPELFFGFWFTSMRSYAEAEPHMGYSILRKWAKMAEERAEKRRSVAEGVAAPDAKAPGPASSSFVLTTNVDGFFLRSGVAPPEAVGEIHGSLARWQCGGVPSGKKFPLVKRPRCGNALFAPPAAEGADFDALRYRADPPRCPICGDGWLRPHVFLFGDGDRFVDDRGALGLDSFGRWREAVLAAMRAEAGLRLVVVEVGCGLRVPNLRKRCEELFVDSPAGQCELIRINPEYEDHKLVASPSISIRAPGLAALRCIHREVCTATAAATAG